MLNNDKDAENPWSFGCFTDDDDTDLDHLDDKEEREWESDSNQQTGEQAEQPSKQTRALVTN